MEHIEQTNARSNFYAAKVRAFATLFGTDYKKIVELCGFSNATYYSRIHGRTPWKHEEIAALCDYWKIDATTFEEGLLCQK